MLRVKRGNKRNRRAKGKKQRMNRNERPFQLEALEPRLLLSADLGISQVDPKDLGLISAPVVENVDRFKDVAATPAGDGLQDKVANGAVAAPADGENAGQASPLCGHDDAGTVKDTGLRQVVIVDATITDRDALLDDIVGDRTDATTIDMANASQKIENRNHEGSLFDIYILDGERDGIDQVSEILSNYSNLDAVHVFSHGDDGSIRLGDNLLTVDELAERNEDLAGWGVSLDAEGDLLLYGCNVAEGDTGATFVKSLASLTGADVAASVDQTGAADLGGDWDLEAHVGSIETPAVVGDTSAYSHLLEDFVSTEENETFTSDDVNADHTFTFNDNWGNDAITAVGTGRDTLDFSGVKADLQFIIAADGSISVTDGTNVLQPITGIDSIIGGTGDNCFIFEDGASFAGDINAGEGGSNTLDYSAYTTAVGVNLADGTATGVGGGISNFKNVIGGAAGDIIVGDSYANEITGGAGNDIIDGLSGEDTLTGGAGDDVFAFSDDWLAATITDADVGANTLDFSNVTNDMEFTFRADGTILADDFTSTLETTGDVASIVSGSGDDTFIFENTATFNGTIDGGAGDNLLDFSAYLTPVRIDLGAGTVDMGGFVNDAGIMEGMTVDMPLAYLNSGKGVGTAAVTGETLLTDLNDGTGVGAAATLTTDTPLGDLNDGAGVGILPTLTAGTLLADLHDGSGISFLDGDDVRITLTTGEEVNVDLDGCTTVGDVLTAITGAHADLTAEINIDGNGINIIDASGGAGDLAVTAPNYAMAAYELGIEGTGTGGLLEGSKIINGLGILSILAAAQRWVTCWTPLLRLIPTLPPKLMPPATASTFLMPPAAMAIFGLPVWLNHRWPGTLA
ncbi:MAG: hypothetical protein B5M56_02295 [Desulfococcus sp. 4484_241]|nr:MAG: hypothetical protein B5M56_02295 [Desulfococcus sp. 4484_241]